MLKRKDLLLLPILLLAAFLVFYRLSELMPFIGDQGWFYLSARDMLLSGKIPLVGITSSHTWLHQGAFWTYILAGVLWMAHFNPVSGAYLTATLGLVTVWLVYKTGSELFSIRIGLIAALLYATSPMVVLYERMAYHTSLIPLLTLLLFYVMYKWIRGFMYGFPLIVLFFAVLYNFEIATFTLTPILFIVLLYGFLKKTNWVKNIVQPKIICLSFLAIIIPMIPMLLYDIHHGYPQTLKFAVWIGYKIATIFGYPHIHPDSPGETYQTMLPFASTLLRRLIFLPSAAVAWFVLFVSAGNVLFTLREYSNPISLRSRFDSFQQRAKCSYALLFLFFIIPTLGYIAEKTNSEAYLAVFFPCVMLMIALLVDRMMRIRYCSIPVLVFLLLFVGMNVYTFYNENFLMGQYGYGVTMQQRVTVARHIVQLANGRKYNVIGRGPGSQYTSFTMNTQYLTWWLGNAPSVQPQKLKFIISETSEKVFLKTESTVIK